MGAVFPSFEPLVGIAFYTYNGCQYILHNHIRGSHLILGLLGQFADESAKNHSSKNHHRQCPQHPKCELHREISECYDATHNEDESTEQFCESHGENVLNGGDVCTDSAVEVAHTPSVVECHGHTYECVECVLTHGEHHLFRHICEQQHPNKRKE